MAKISSDLEQKLEYVGLEAMAGHLDRIMRSSEGSVLTPLQLLRELVDQYYLDYRNRQFQGNLRLSRLRQQVALMDNLNTGNGRVYQDVLVDQLSTLEFIEDGANITVAGESYSGKTYFLRAFCIEACKANYRTLFVDYTDLMDDLIVRKQKSMRSYRQRLRFYANVQFLLIDDFLISKYDDQALDGLYNLIKERRVLAKATMVSTQFGPDEWANVISADFTTYAKADGIRTRIIEDGFIVEIQRAN